MNRMLIALPPPTVWLWFHRTSLGGGQFVLPPKNVSPPRPEQFSRRRLFWKDSPSLQPLTHLESTRWHPNEFLREPRNHAAPRPHNLDSGSRNYSTGKKSPDLERPLTAGWQFTTWTSQKHKFFFSGNVGQEAFTVSITSFQQFRGCLNSYLASKALNLFIYF